MLEVLRPGREPAGEGPGLTDGMGERAPASSGVRRRAVVDIGTNSVRLLVADLLTPGDAAGVADGVRLRHVHRDLAMPRIGRGVDRSGRLSEEAMGAAAAVVRSFVDKARQLGAEVIDVVGTSALRDAVNRDVFVELVRRECGVDVRVITGREEAELSFLGAVRGTPLSRRDAGASAPEVGSDAVYVLDIGGGSTELVRGRADGAMESAVSVDVGAVRMTELCVQSDPISERDWERLVREVRIRVQPLLSARDPNALLLAVGGTATTLAAMKQRLVVYDPQRVHGFVLTRSDVEQLADALRAAPVAERRTWPGLQPERADIILAGAVIACQVMAGLDASTMIVSESDLLEGILLKGALPTAERGL